MSAVLSACKWLSGVLTSVVHNFDTHQGFWLVSLTIVLVFIGIVTCRAASRNDRERSRPYVILEAMPGIFLGVRLSNIGLTMAKNVKVTASPPIKISLGNHIQEPRFLSKGVACLPPRALHKTILGTFADLQKNNPELVFKGTIAYEDDRRHKYSEDFVLDYSLFNDVAYSSDENEIASSIKELVRKIDNIRFASFK